jgi:hypothetical protein
MRNDASSWAPISSSFDWSDQVWSQMRTALATKQGMTNRTAYRVTRRSKGARCFFLRETVAQAGLEPILFHPPIQGAAAQAERFRGLADVALKAL